MWYGDQKMQRQANNLNVLNPLGVGTQFTPMGTWLKQQETGGADLGPQQATPYVANIVRHYSNQAMGVSGFTITSPLPQNPPTAIFNGACGQR